MAEIGLGGRTKRLDLCRWPTRSHTGITSRGEPIPAIGGLELFETLCPCDQIDSDQRAPRIRMIIKRFV